MKCQDLFSFENKKKKKKSKLSSALVVIGALRIKGLLMSACNTGTITSEKVPSDKYTQERFRSACTFMQSNQNPHWIAKDTYGPVKSQIRLQMQKLI